MFASLSRSSLNSKHASRCLSCRGIVDRPVLCALVDRSSVSRSHSPFSTAQSSLQAAESTDSTKKRTKVSKENNKGSPPADGETKERATFEKKKAQKSHKASPNVKKSQESPLNEKDTSVAHASTEQIKPKAPKGGAKKPQNAAQKSASSSADKAKNGLPRRIRSLRSGKMTKNGKPTLRITKTKVDTSYPGLLQYQKLLVRGIYAHSISGLAMRRSLLKVVKDGGLLKEDMGPAISILRKTSDLGLGDSPIPGFQTLRGALTSNPSATAARESAREAAREAASRATIKAAARDAAREAAREAMYRNNSTRSARPRTGFGSNSKLASGKADSQPSAALKSSAIETLNLDDLELVPVDTGPLEVPGVAYGLERVLFNPGVYHLQDPRSRVYNFDPYLQTIMPVSEFDFNALKQYVTSSKDKNLLKIANEQKKKYTGSTSSTTSALAHFHYLLSQWRMINPTLLSKDFPVDYLTFTSLQRSPVAIFLRYHNGSYAIDADKEFDRANILSTLGKSMEKLLTLPKEGFERYRKGRSDEISEEERNADEAFHYTTIGDFLLRSQLDAHDPRLPGTGMYDLKTRAVVSIRMDTKKWQETSGYEIRGQHGQWESYEREYYDMIRAAFMKYSLQVRMGRMDGIFVAFHNTERIFGFQYISQSEMDIGLHGTSDLTLGDTEFKYSLGLMNRVLDRATAKFPGKSLRLHFETRDTQVPFMYIFAEPVEEEEIDRIQSTNKAETDAFEREVLGLTHMELSEDQKRAEWESLRARVEESVEEDELGLGKTKTDLLEDINGGWTDEQQQEVDSILSAAAEDGSSIDENDEDDLVNDEEETDLESSEDVGLIEDGEDVDDENADTEEVEEANTILGTRQEDQSTNRNMVNPNATTQEFEIYPEGSSDGEDGVVSSESEDEPSQEKDSTSEAESSNAEESVPSTPSEHADNDQTPPQLDSTSSEPLAEPVEGPLLAMILTIRNKVNGVYVTRPNSLTSDDKWTIEYTLEDVDMEERARKLYDLCKARRAATLRGEVDAAKEVKPNSYNQKYFENLKKLSRRGRRWRQEMEEKEKGLPPKVLGMPITSVKTEEIVKSEH